MKLVAALAVICSLVVVGCGSTHSQPSKLSLAMANMSRAGSEIVQADKRQITTVERLRRLEWRYEAEEAWGLLTQVRDSRIRGEKSIKDNSTTQEIKQACRSDHRIFCEHGL